MKKLFTPVAQYNENVRRRNVVEYSEFSSKKYFGTEKVKTLRYCDVPEMVRYKSRIIQFYCERSVVLWKRSMM